MCKNFCEHIREILEIETEIIEDHIAHHKWCNGIEDRNEAIADFVHKYAWIIREVFCGAMCKYRNDCRVVDEFKKSFLENVSDGELKEMVEVSFDGNESDDLIQIKMQIVKHDIIVHKWLNRIPDYQNAVKDFLNKFGWVIYEIYQKSNKRYKWE